MTNNITSPEELTLKRISVSMAGTIIALLMLPIVIFLSVPIMAWVICLILTIANKLIILLSAHFVRNSTPTIVLGVMGFSMLGRAFVTAVTLFFVGAEITGAGEKTIGLDRPDLAIPALILFVITYTIDALIELIGKVGSKSEMIEAESKAVEPTT